MKKHRGAWLIAVLVCMVLLIGVGYAKLTDTLSLSGEVNVEGKPFKGIYISDVVLVSSSGISDNTYSYIKPTNLQTTVTATNSKATVTYKVTVHNNSDITYWYINQVLLSGYDSNNLVNKSGGITVTTRDFLSDSAGSFNSNDWVPPNTYRDFYVTYSYGANAQGTHTNLINFKFDIKMDAIHDQFLAVLNDKESDRGYYYLAQAFNEKYASTGSTVLGNVGEDKVIFDELFGSQMTVNIDGVERPVTVHVSRRNVDNRTTGDAYPNGASGCEYTVYITVDNPDKAKQSVTVYAVSYTCKSDGTWYQIGQLYEGTTLSVDYDTTNTAYDFGFDVMQWDATAKTYEVMGNYSYKVGYANGETFDMYDSIEEIMSTNDQSFVNRVNNSKEFLITVCKTLYTYSYNHKQTL